MPLVSRSFTYSAGAVIIASQHNTNENTLYNLVNGNLDTSNLSASAAIVDTQLAQITSTNKVAVSAVAPFSSLTTVTGLGADYIVISDTSDSGNNKKALGSDFMTVSASQAEMEAASSTTVYASPGRIVNHPGVAKVWLNWDGSAASPITPTIAYGISGSTITKGSTGVYTITFATNFSSTNYCMTSQAWDTTVPIGCTVRMATKNVGSVVIECYRTATGTLTDAEEINIAIWGDQ